MLSLFLAAAPAAPAPTDLDFPLAARRFAEARGVESPEAREVDVDALLEEHFAHARVGAFDVHFPASVLEDKRNFDRVCSMAVELLGAQERWLEWVAAGDEAERFEELDIDEHFERVERWIESWRRGSLSRAFDDGQRDFTPGPEEDEDLSESARLLMDLLGRGEPLPLGRQEPRFTPLYLIPERKDFVELACFYGWIYPNLRHEYWTPETWGWTSFFYEDSHFIALSFATAGGKDGSTFTGDYTRGTSMEKFNKKGLEQQVVQLGLRALLENYFGDRLPPSFNAGLSSLLVIDIYGEVDTRTDGDLRPKATQAKSVFVPGGASSGGTLPPDYADGRFRSPNHGSDFFVPILEFVQKQGSKEVRKKSEKHRSFELLSDDEKDEYVLQAPLLHVAAERIAPPAPAFQGDLLEFLRSYRICFLHFLRDHAESTEAKSRRAFAELLNALASPEGGLDAAFEAVYEAPLSDADASSSSLEGRFLRWLAKQ